MIGSDAYNYINVLNKAAGASWTRNEIIANNIANVDTPDYKRKDLNFESLLAEALSDTTTKMNLSFHQQKGLYIYNNLQIIHNFDFWILH